MQTEELQKELMEAQRALEQYPDTTSPIQTVPVVSFFIRSLTFTLYTSTLMGSLFYSLDF